MYAIKTELHEPLAGSFALDRQKTMYGGKKVAVGDTIYLFASENEGGRGLVAKGVVTAANAVPKIPDVERQTPRVSIVIRCTKESKRRLGRDELRQHSNWHDGRPETELNFKFYRQATNKIVGISEEAAAFLECHF